MELAALPPTIVTSARQKRFTRDGGPELETFLEETCQKVKSNIEELIPTHRLDMILLGGGYGRGEGGVLVQGEMEKPYNDLEFYLFLSGHPLMMQRLYGTALHRVAERLSEEAGVEVEFKILSLAKLRKSPVTMFYYDLLSGHKIILGDPNLLRGCEHHQAAHRIPLHEATRLLMNRCSGLLFAKERLARSTFTRSDADFVYRNIAKAKLALGDVLLTTKGEYHWSCLERHQRLLLIEERTLPTQSIQQAHGEGVQFKLHPIQSEHPRSDLMEEHQKITTMAERVWYWLEGKRLGCSFTSPEDYSFSSASKCPETHRIKNALINTRQFGWKSLLESRRAVYPRERLLRSLPLLLWDDQSLGTKVKLNLLKTQLQSTAESFPELISAYENLWRRYN
jgi:hypothetical protein